MPVQPITEKQNNWAAPTITGGVVGGLAGATFAGPKYKTFEDLVAAASDKDKFEKLMTPSDSAEQAVKDNYKAVKEGVEAANENVKKVGELFKDGKTATATDVLKELGLEQPVKNKVNLGEEVVKLGKKEAETDIPDAIKAIFKAGENVDDAAMKTGLKEMGVEVLENGKIKVGDDALKTAKNFANQKGVLDFVEAAEKDTGKVTKEAAENLAKAGSSAAKTAFESIQKSLGKAWVKGAAIWGAVGLVVGYIASKFMNKKAA